MGLDLVGGKETSSCKGMVAVDVIAGTMPPVEVLEASAVVGEKIE